MKSKVKVNAKQLIKFYNEGYKVSEMTVLLNQELEQQFPDDENYRVTDAVIREMFTLLNQKFDNKYDLRKKPQRKLVELDFSDIEPTYDDEALNDHENRKEEWNNDGYGL